MARDAFQTLSEPMYYVLLALIEECCGVDIMAKVKELSRGRVSVGPGTLYTMLQKFYENNMVVTTRSDNLHKWYIITEKGLEMLKGERQRLKIQYEDGAKLDNM